MLAIEWYTPEVVVRKSIRNDLDLPPPPPGTTIFSDPCKPPFTGSGVAACAQARAGTSPAPPAHACVRVCMCARACVCVRACVCGSQDISGSRSGHGTPAAGVERPLYFRNSRTKCKFRNSKVPAVVPNALRPARGPIHCARRPQQAHGSGPLSAFARGRARRPTQSAIHSVSASPSLPRAMAKKKKAAKPAAKK